MCGAPGHRLTSTSVRTGRTTLRISVRDFRGQVPDMFSPFTNNNTVPLRTTQLKYHSCNGSVGPITRVVRGNSMRFPRGCNGPVACARRRFVTLCNGRKMGLCARGFNIVPADGMRVPGHLSFSMRFCTGGLLTVARTRIKRLCPSSRGNGGPITCC